MIGAAIKADDIRVCDICARGLMENRAITFFRVTFERMFIDLDAVRGVSGLSQILGSQRLASVMAPNDKIAVPICPGDELIVCDHCAISRDDRVFYMAERAAEAACVRGQKA